MTQQKVVIIDTGTANLASVHFALARLGIETKITADADLIKSADKLILPGVGTAVAAMQNLKERHLPEILADVTKPVLGICLGMQMLSKDSSETMQKDVATIPCLGKTAGVVRPLQAAGLTLPHMGWNQVFYTDKECPLFKDIPEGSWFYFVHSYALSVTEDTAAVCTYGQKFTAVVHHNNFYGTQFHPEKSGKEGAVLLRNFVEM